MASKQQLLFIFCQLFVLFHAQLVLAQDEPEAQQLQVPRPRGRIRIADMQPPPLPGHGPLSWPNYGAVPAPMPATSTVHSHIPLLREPQSQSSPASEGVVQESVVYGNWKPEHPHQPQVEEEESQPKQRVYGRLEAMLMGLPAEAESSEQLESQQLQEQRTAPASGYHNPYARQDSFEQTHDSHGRWRAPLPKGFKESKLQPKPKFQSQLESQSSFEVIRLNASDPLLKAMAKQINESIETTTMRRQATHTTEDNWMPLPYPYPTHSYESTQPVPGPSSSRVRSTEAATLHPTQLVESTTIALNWPTDFLEATPSSTPRTYTDAGISIDRVDNIDSIDRIDDDIVDQNDQDYKYYEDNLSSAQMHSELSVPETLIPQLPLNITRVGIPYEDRNSMEEPTICVPLTVSETASESANPLLVEVERVYCFPLPKVEIRTGNIRQQQSPAIQQEQEPEQERSSNATAMPADEAQPTTIAGSSSRYNILTMVLVIGSCLLARL